MSNKSSINKELKMRIHISTPEFANKLCEICTPYTKEFDIDIVRGRCILDASSMLGILSMLGKDVDIIPHTHNKRAIIELFEKIDTI
jgi:predicted nucleic-acid-binding Zn-ribbon protein